MGLEITFPCDREGVLALLPHRDPFVWVSRVVSCKPGESIVAELDVDPALPLFAGHFPGHPVLPGVILMEALAQAACCCLLSEEGQAGRIGYLAGIDKAKFRRTVLPGDTVTLEAVITRNRRRGLRSGNAEICNGESGGRRGTIMAKPNASVADSTVVYQLSLLEQAINAPLLVVGYGSPMKACVKACVKNECSQIWVTGTKDKEKGFSCSGSARVALLGDKFDARLFTNVYAVIQAAKMCGAGALLVCDTNFVADPLLRMVAHQNGICVLTPMEKDRSHSLWVECHPDPAFAEHEPNWRRCPKCKMYHDEQPVLATGGVCPTCGELYRLTSSERIELLFDEGSFEEWDASM